MSTTQADFKAACERRGLTPSQDLFSFWQDARLNSPASGAALSSEPVFPLSLLEEIAQKRAESIPGPGGFPCTQSEIASFKKAFLKEWMPRAIAHQPPKEALTDEQKIELAFKHKLAFAVPQHLLSYTAAIEDATGPNKALVAALKLARAHLDWSMNGDEFRKIAAEIDAVLAAAGVTLKGE